jgi:pimeloyl-ACP methyl ester carboxylesterase
MIQAHNFLLAGPAGKLAVRTKGMERHREHVVVLVQGANISGQAGYDFHVPGRDDYSAMDYLVSRGFGTLTFSVRGYAQSEIPPDPLAIDTNAAIEDLSAIVHWLNAEGYTHTHLAGWSWGGRIVARYAENNQGKVRRLALLDPALGGANPIPPDPSDPWWSGGWDYFYERLEPEFSEPEAARALADFVTQHEPCSPNGIRRENARGSIAAQAENIRCPTLMVYGSAAAKQNYMQGGVPRETFFAQLATDDKAFVIVPGCGDYAHLQKPRRRFLAEVADFLLS